LNTQATVKFRKTLEKSIHVSQYCILTSRSKYNMINSIKKQW